MIPQRIYAMRRRQWNNIGNSLLYLTYSAFFGVGVWALIPVAPKLPPLEALVIYGVIAAYIGIAAALLMIAGYHLRAAYRGD
jgi:hypothetical protein